MYKIIGADGKEYGPVTAEQLRQWMAEGRVNHQTSVQVDGASRWQTLASLPEFGGAVPPVASPRIGMEKVPSYLAPAILCTIFCCLPFGIPAIVFAAQVNTKLAAGDAVGAQEASRKARTWCWVSFWLGLMPAAIWIAVVVLAGILSA
jgi:hypothetical protein